MAMISGAGFFQAWYSTIIWFRFSRLAFDVLQFWGYLRLKPPVQPQDPHNVTIVSLTLGTEPAYETTVRYWVRADPGKVNVVTVAKAVPRVKEVLDRIGDDRISLFWVEKPSARDQLCEGIRNVNTQFWVLADDRSFWPRETLEHLTSALADPTVGGAMTMQKVRPRNGRRFTIWESFGALNLVRRNMIHASLAYWNHGQVLNLSGRLSIYRTHIFQSEEFYHALKNELWLGKYPIKTGDDSFMYNWILQRGWRTSFQNDKGVTITTGVSHNSLYLKQLLRWLRDGARQTSVDFVFALGTGRFQDIYRSTLNIISNYSSDAAVLNEVLLILCLYLSGWGKHSRIKPSVGNLFREHLLITSILTLFEHAPFFEKPGLLLYLPSTVLYCYIHAAVALYAYLTLDLSVWGSRPGVDDPGSAKQGALKERGLQTPE